MNFRCNYRKCRKELISMAIVTSCSHIFCPDHSPGKLITDANSQLKRRDIRCPVCKASLNQAFDFVEADLQPNDAFKGMVMTGLRPETIIEIAARALGFWMYQMEQELQYNQYLIKKHMDKAGSMESEFVKAYNSLNEEKNILLVEKGNLSRECEELREKLITESRLVEKMTGEQKFMYSQANSKSSFIDHEKARQCSNKFLATVSNSQMNHNSVGNFMQRSGSMMISPDSTFGESCIQKTDQANRVWGIGQYHSSNLYQKSENKENSHQVGRRFLSPLENILNKKTQQPTSGQRRMMNSIGSTDTTPLSFGFI